ncbi:MULTISPECIES: DUF2244 domain-containing protein [unclassified Ruegeria]|uniref:DUF2244 domain-containing protein n=1 Tax=unclassified Ruegeria TaxID=2625375 RepID=UPI00148812EC|nr:MULTISPECIES: DUF2244 domain-containing protein [unclassified Ruegeria]NOD33790.1 DUF2244 domain-containing protein [Ruegeria sp. HKCCD7296]NOE40535.1 DUF2244 domain-containing protein [Ruegeria sp. HKCCD7319]
MPYTWNQTSETEQELRLWPHNSLPPRGAFITILSVFMFGLIPLLAMLGSVVLWGLLPFLLITVFGLWLAIQTNYRARSVFEVLTLSDTQAHLVHYTPGKDQQEWSCNRFWARTEMHEKGGPVPHYVTLVGDGREVEIGSFLSEDERITLYDELSTRLRERVAQ